MRSLACSALATNLDSFDAGSDVHRETARARVLSVAYSALATYSDSFGGGSVVHRETARASMLSLAYSTLETYSNSVDAGCDVHCETARAKLLARARPALLDSTDVDVVFEAFAAGLVSESATHVDGGAAVLYEVAPAALSDLAAVACASVVAVVG
eukprot:TRINITY_DN1443_c1_g1_i14.p4 TRINITY_DN1443_c1_g1~~TRINITY_DN1443_c1_g1_i14.p4  ORF type:complete len:156 (+),score=21.70 TRINITY_DN1443_c1_g1_i14:698-1165(+)